MAEHPAVRDVLRCFQSTRDRYESHRRLSPLIAKLCKDREFLFDAIRGCLANPAFLRNADNLSLPIVQSGDVGMSVHLFVPLRDGAPDITFDNIHHHGWRLLTSGVTSGDGYEAILFRRRSHENRTGDTVHLEVEEIYRFGRGSVRFVDSHTAHVVFHPPSLTSTLAVWSADRILVNQKIKKGLGRFPRVRRMAVRSAHALRVGWLLGLNAVEGLYFHPEGGRIVETQNYSKSRDGEREEILGCIFRFLQQVEFEDVDFLRRIAADAPPEAVRLIDKLIAGEPVPDTGIWGHLRRRFTKTQILQAIEHSRRT